jgi:hypothetical protein
MHSHELSLGYYKGRWSLNILKRECDTYVEAWKVPGGQLEHCPDLHTLKAIHPSWPPL